MFAGEKKRINQTPWHWNEFHLEFALTKTIQKALGKGLTEVATCNWGATGLARDPEKLPTNPVQRMYWAPPTYLKHM